MKTTKLTHQAADQLEGEFLYEQLYNVFKNMKHNKSSGLDGFNVAFLKIVLIDIGIYILRSLHYGYRIVSLSVTQNRE